MQKKYKHQTKKLTREGNNQVVHVKLENPLTVRRNILGSALDSARMLKTYSELKEVKKMKQGIIEDFTNVYDEIKILFRRLEHEELPSVVLDEKTEEPKEVAVKPLRVQAKERIVGSEIDRLKAELDAIEKRLSSL